MPEFLDQQRLNEKLAQYMREFFFKVAETHEQRSIRNRISIWREALRKKISTFSQLPSESFWQAWQRFDGYQRERPHHEYSDTEVLLFFYNGIRECHQDELDDDAFLEFSVQDTQEAYRLIANLAASSYDDSIEYDRMKAQEKDLGAAESKDASPDFVEEQMNLHLGDITCTSKEETEKIDSELAVVGAESAEEINLQPLPERADTLEEELGAAESKEVMLEFIEEPPPVATIQTTLVVQEEVTTLDEDTLQSQEVQELEDAPRSELCMETEDMSLAETCHDSFSAETEDFSLADTEDISTMENQTRHGFCAEEIIESAATPRSGPDKPEYHTVSQFDRIVHHDIGDSLANIWSMSKKGNGFPWDDGISKELKMSNDPGVDGRNFWVSNLLQPPLILDQNRSGFLIKDGGTPAGIPRSGPDIPSFYEFDQSQFLSFAGEGGSITYCDIIGSVTRPPEILLSVPVLC